MNDFIASDLPYVVGIVVIFAAAIWLIGRAADRGLVARYSDLVLTLIIASLFATTAILDLAKHQWVVATTAVFMAALALFNYWRRRRAR